MKRALWLWALAVLVPVAMYGSFPTSGGVWPDGPVPICISLAGGPMNVAEAEAAAREAMASWNPYLQRVQLVPVSSTEKPWYSNGRNEIFFANTIYGEQFGRGVVGVTMTLTFDRDERTEIDIVLNAAFAVPWGTYHGAIRRETVELRRVLVHELGHLLGLDHPDEAGQDVAAIMNSTASDIETPTADDQSGVRSLYDRNSNAAPAVVAGPRISTQEVMVGGRVKFEVLAGGRGPYFYQWRRDGVPVSGATASVLRLDPVKLEEGGNYSVVISNRANSVTSRSVALTVRQVSPPQLLNVSGNWDYTLQMGGDFTFRAVDVANTVLTKFEWKHNGVVVGTTDSATFTIKDVQFSDSGDYTVTATNGAGSVTGRTFHIKVEPVAANRFLIEPAPVDFLVGSTATLNIESSGVATSTTTYQWAKNGVDIPGAVGRSLSIGNFRASDAGSYTLTITDAWGQSTSAPLVVSVRGTALAGPIIVRQPSSQTAFVGTRAGMTARVNTSPFTYRWLKDGVPVTAFQEASAQQSQVDLSYAIPTLIKPEDAGTYTLEVVNGLGSTTSRGAKLTVVPAIKPIITTQPASPTVKAGDTVTLSCVARVSYSNDGQQQFPGSPLRVQWFKGSTVVQPEQENGFSYSFTASAASAGQYYARVTSPAGLVTDTKTCTVTVTTGELPLITTQPPDLLYNMYDSEEIRLASIAFVVASRRYARQAENSGFALVTPSGPAFGGVTPGTYVMFATRSGVTETSQPFTIEFIPPVTPVVYSQPASQKPDIGQLVEISANIFSLSPLTFQWSKDGVPITGATNSYFVVTRSFEASQAGSYQLRATGVTGTFTTEPALLEVATSGVPVIVTQPRSQIIVDGRRIAMDVVASGASLSYQWYKDGRLIGGGTNAELFVPSEVGSSGGYAVAVSNGTASVLSKTATVRVLAAERPPEILSPARSLTAALNGDAVLAVSADGAPLPDRYQWRRNGVDIPGATDAKLRLTNVQPGDAGAYTAIAYNRLGSAASPAIELTVDGSGRLVNLATRAGVGTGADVLIAGFVISGTKPRAVLVRGVGDQLSEFGVKGVLQNPLLKLFDANKKLVASSDDWFDGDEGDPVWQARIAALRAAEKETGAFRLNEDTLDGAVVATLEPGSYTAQVSGFLDTTGVGLVEVYELGKPATDRLINLSCRSRVGTGAAILIPGLVVRGNAPRRLLIRAVGPGLGDFGVVGTLVDPQLKVFRDSEEIAQNDNWSGADVAQTAATVGAFPLAVGSKDAALLIDLPEGTYTVQVSGVGDTQGIALVEVYEVRP